jgi:hypothetical protein
MFTDVLTDPILLLLHRSVLYLNHDISDTPKPLLKASKAIFSWWNVVTYVGGVAGVVILVLKPNTKQSVLLCWNVISGLSMIFVSCGFLVYGRKLLRDLKRLRGEKSIGKHMRRVNEMK